MRLFFVSVVLITNTLIFVNGGSDDKSVAELIKNLGSRDYTAREKAEKALRERQDAEAQLREAARTADSETRRRIEQILEYFDRRPIRELHALAKEGCVDEVISRVAAWPAGKFDNEVWNVMVEMTQTICDHADKKGTRFGPARRFQLDSSPRVIKQAKILYTTRAEEQSTFFLRTEELDLGPPPMPVKGFTNDFDKSSFPVVRTNARYVAAQTPPVTYTGKNLFVSAGHDNEAVMVCGGDVTLIGNFCNCLIIARGSVTCIKKDGDFIENYVISGKRVTHFARPDHNNIIRENDPNPLGYIRWSDPPKAKVEPKSK